ncbi:alkaline phosphatase PafA [Flavihumibacter stibioxidans]|uniref:Nucleotide pyrophosphatase n=1 Tax=Flavihumibacter stibioxidans TaxID=1834163 RepID=A0ABR7MC68_9BACT|nr:alkaline phosphatase PafA [Flavihumibacter stibioxidans]MBC6492551.1 nucleotide pyrophosphatase [Flavihumibacter stibioxidans]
MSLRFLLILIFSASLSVSFSQQKSTGAGAETVKPKLVVGLVVDQMRWDFLYRYSDRYKPDGGFRRLLSHGFSNENTFIPYSPTVTACGHSTIYTGTVPAISGITGNAWYDQREQRVMYCTEDKSVKTVGSTTASGEMSPRNMHTTTIGDELRLATNFRSKVIGVAIKDRGGILPAGHSANGAYWYDSKSGNWITSTYYRNDLPAWVSGYNQGKHVDKYYETGWSTLYPVETYINSSKGENTWEAKPFGSAALAHPYNFKNFIGKNYGVVASTPFGNTMTLEMAKAAVKGEELGQGKETDMLTVSLSSPDYIGHAFGPNSIEVEDCYLRLDKDLGDFLNFLDKEIGQGQYLLFLSADHGVAHIPGFMKANKIPAGTFDDGAVMDSLNSKLKEKFGQEDLVISMFNYQVHLNHNLIDSLKLDKEDITNAVIRMMKKQPEVSRVFELEELAETTLPEKLKSMIANGYHPNRSGDIQFVLYPQYIDGGPTGTTHGMWNPYDAHIPLVWYGWNIKPGKSNSEVYMTDIAPTIAAMLRIQMPNGTVGKPIEALLK